MDERLCSGSLTEIYARCLMTLGDATSSQSGRLQVESNHIAQLVIIDPKLAETVPQRCKPNGLRRPLDAAMAAKKPAKPVFTCLTVSEFR